MSEAVATIIRLERRVMWRMRLLSLQDSLALAVMTSGLISAGVVLLARLRPIQFSLSAVIIGAVGILFTAALTRWFLIRTREGDAAFLIDEALKLDDRLATSRLIIERGGPKSALEEALIEDAAERVSTQRAASVVPFRMRRWYTLSLISVIALATALMIPTRSLSVADAVAAERADVESAGEHLEQSAAEVEQAVQPGTETATLAKEQSELGRGFRRSPLTRAEALRRLSALEERIRGRHDDLASTRADEIVSLADRRLGSALSTLSKAPRKKIEVDADQAAVSAEGPGNGSKRELNEETQTSPAGRPKLLESPHEKASKSGPANSQTQASTRGEQPNIDVKKANGPRQEMPQKRPQEPVSDDRQRKTASSKSDSTKQDLEAKKTAPETGASADQKPSEEKVTDLKGGAEKTDEGALERKADDQRPGEQSGALEALKAVPSSLAEQAAKALPKMSEELLKKATELRANELTPADIEKLRKAAEFLSRDLAQIAQSKELQQALKEMARQVRPEQIEQVARELGNQEKLKQELEAAVRLLSQNQQAKEMVAGLAGQLAGMQDERRQRDNGQPERGKADLRGRESRAYNQPSRSNRVNGAPETFETGANRRLAGQGRESSVKGKLQQGSGGEYLYLQSKAGVGAARAPYSSAYPQYRREAERSVQRSQVPPALRSVVRKYFDAINPDAKR